MINLRVRLLGGGQDAVSWKRRSKVEWKRKEDISKQVYNTEDVVQADNWDNVHEEQDQTTPSQLNNAPS